jgi:hypothetical protein
MSKTKYEFLEKKCSMILYLGYAKRRVKYLENFLQCIKN